MALAQETGVLLLDEPTTFLDPAHQIEILDLLKDLNLPTAGRSSSACAATSPPSPMVLPIGRHHDPHRANALTRARAVSGNASVEQA